MAFDSYNDIMICASPRALRSGIDAISNSSVIWGISILSECDVDELQKMTKDILSLKCRVCLWIDEEVYRGHAEKLSGLFFILYGTNYLFRHNQAVIYFVGARSKCYESSGESFSKAIGALGFASSIKDVEGWTLSGIHGDNWFLQVGNDTLSKEELVNNYFYLLTCKFFIDQNICIFGRGQKDLSRALDVIEQTERSVAKSHPHLHELFGLYRSLSRQNEELANENKRLGIDVVNQKRYLAVLRNEKEMEKIIEFYHSEYEVLPLWYKRFGHMIKLLTGKRKVRSNHNQR